MPDLTQPNPLPQPEPPAPIVQEHAPPAPGYWFNLLLLVLTFFTTLVVGAHLQLSFNHNLPPLASAEDVLPLVHPQWFYQHPRLLLLGLPFSLTLMGILLAHEMGHYLSCRYYRVPATLPYFVPAPTLIGTLGAFIRIRGGMQSRAVLFDIGIAGPIAGFVAALPVLTYGLLHSRTVNVPVSADSIHLGFPMIFDLAWRLLRHGQPHVALRDIYLHPVTIAAWVGMFATSLNLLPGGQLDGGHIVYAWWPRGHKWISRLTIAALIPFGVFYWVGWLVWAVLLSLTGMRHPNVPGWPPLDQRRTRFALIALVLLALTLIPAPFIEGSGVDAVQSVLDGLRH